MSNKDKGGPAFPNEGFNGWGEPFQGMSLRDYFAAKAMQGMLAENGGGAMNNDELADWAYLLADAMLKAREE